MEVFLGVDWAEDHHDLCLMDPTGTVLATRRIPDGLDGAQVLHALVAERAEEPAEVIVGIETDHGLLAGSLVAAQYQVYAVNPMSVARYRDRHHSSRRSRTRATPSCWPTWSAPTGTTTAAQPRTASSWKRSRCWPGAIRA